MADRQQVIWAATGGQTADGTIDQQVGFLLPARNDIVYRIFGYRLGFIAQTAFAGTADDVAAMLVIGAGTDNFFSVAASPAVGAAVGLARDNLRTQRVIDVLRYFTRMATAVGNVPEHLETGWAVRDILVPSVTAMGLCRPGSIATTAEYHVVIEYEPVHVSPGKLASVNLMWGVDPQDRTRVVPA